MRNAVVMMLMCLVWGAAAQAQDVRFFQLGTGPVGESRFALGGLVANVLTNPPGSRPCDKGGSCGVPGLVAVARSTSGSQANLQALNERRLDGALIHEDVMFWAIQGQGPYKGRQWTSPVAGIAQLYREALHLVVRPASGIKTVADLKGKRVGLGDGSDGLARHSRTVLSMAGLPDSAIKPQALAPRDAAQALMAGTLDAFFVFDAVPSPLVDDLARHVPIVLIGLDEALVHRSRGQNPFLGRGVIAADTYAGQAGALVTLDMGVDLVVRADLDAHLTFDIIRAIDHPSTLAIMAQGDRRGGLFKPDIQQMAAIGLRPHDGVARFLSSLP